MNMVEEVRSHFYTFAEAAQVLAVSKVTLWRWAKAGRVEGHHLGREVLFEREAVEALRRR